MKTKGKEKYVPALSFDFLTPLYDPLIALTNWEKTFKSELRHQTDVQPGERVLDLACGTATLTIAIKQEQPAAKVFGLDGDKRILAKARQKSDSARAEINFTRAFSTAMPYLDEFFDCVVTSLFFHHLTRENKKKTLLEIFRVLKPNGRLHIADWDRPANLLMKLAQQPVIWLDGATTRDSFEGKLPEFIREARFADVVETSIFNTIGGTVRLHKAIKR
jgi:ubiquinone/menaquinone biosynthesis C-methylase UbiE